MSKFESTVAALLAEAEADLALVPEPTWFEQAITEEELPSREDLNAGQGNSTQFRLATHNYSALMQHAMRGQLEPLCALLEQGADVNHQDATGDTALAWAALGGQLSTCAVLIERNADVNILAQDHATALMRATVSGFPDVCRLLVAAKANLAEPNYHSHTALRLGVYNGQHQVVAALVDCEADLSFNEDQESLIGLAAQLGFDKVAVALLEAGADPNETFELGTVTWTPLLQACRHGQHRVLSVLMEYGADPDESGGSSLATPACMAARNGDAIVLKTILQARASVTKADGAGHSPLMRAVQAGHLTCARTLLQFRASPREPAKRNPLTLALAIQDPELQERMIALLTAPLAHGSEEEEAGGGVTLGQKALARGRVLARKFERVVQKAMQEVREEMARKFVTAMRFGVASKKFAGGQVHTEVHMLNVDGLTRKGRKV